LAVGQTELTWVQNGPVGIEKIYSHVPHIDIAVNNGLHVQWWSHKIIIL